MKKILFVVPSFDGHIHFKLQERMENIELPEGFELQIEVISRKLIHVARNQAIQQCLTLKCDYLCMIDDDSVPTRPDALKLLIEADKDIIWAIYRKRHTPFNLALYEMKHDPKNNFRDFKEYKTVPEWTEDVFEVGNIGTGFMLYKAEFLEKIFQNYDYLPFENKLCYFVPTMIWMRVELDHEFWHPLIKLEEDGKLRVMKVPLSEDLLFHYRARIWQYKIYAHRQVLLDHYTDIENFISV